ncbi:MAG: polyribonucleotide nucleotidyltransferase, partial [Kiritimatiellae bacterium]|nr:polyribonucleotide nucleotidyltransferase [Kiritimatiellia bacterium]
MNQTTSVAVEIDGQTITIETGLLAMQAAGAVTVRLGDTVLFSAVTNTDQPREGIDYFPLQVEYRERYYAAGRFPGGYFKREQRPSERETLIARLTDRPIRPLFPEGYRNDVQVNNLLLSTDAQNDPDVLSVIAASTALHISDIPFYGPIAAVRIGRVKGAWVINPTREQRAQSDLDLMYAGTRDRFLMMEGGADEIADADFLAAMKRAQEEVVKLVEAQLEL